MGHTRKSTNVTILCRLAYPQIWEPAAIKLGGGRQGQIRYSAVLALDNPAEIEKVKQAQQAVLGAWADGQYPNPFHWAMNPGSDKHADDENLSKMMLLNAYANPEIPGQEPKVYQRDAQGNTFMVKADTHRHIIYSGCEAYVAISLFTYHNSMTDGGIATGLNMVMPTNRDQVRFDGRVSADVAFAEATNVMPSGGMPAPAGGQVPPGQGEPANAPPMPSAQQQQQVAPNPQQQVTQPVEQPASQGNPWEGQPTPP